MLTEAKREEGPVEILCKEIGFRFDKRMERPAVLVAFVAILVSHVASMRAMQEQIAPVTKSDGPTADSGVVLGRVLDMLASNDPDGLIDKAAAIHDFIHEVAPDEAYPCDHLIDMLSSCVSAIRFGLEKPCRSRHAAAAASHIWGHVYGVRLFDNFTSGWQKEWARAQMQEALVLCMAEAGRAALGKEG